MDPPMARGPFGLGCFTFQECAASLRCRGPWVLGRLSPFVDRAGQCLFGSEGCGISNMRSPNRARLVFTLRTCTGEVAEDPAAFRLRSLAGIRGASSYALPAEAWKRKGRGIKRAVPLGHSDQDAHSARGCRALAVNMTYEQHATYGIKWQGLRYDGCSSRHAKDQAPPQPSRPHPNKVMQHGSVTILSASGPVPGLHSTRLRPASVFCTQQAFSSPRSGPPSGSALWDCLYSSMQHSARRIHLTSWL